MSRPGHGSNFAVGDRVRSVALGADGEPERSGLVLDVEWRRTAEPVVGGSTITRWLLVELDAEGHPEVGTVSSIWVRAAASAKPVLRRGRS